MASASPPGSSGAGGSSRQARGKAATQERILIAATELFMEQGYEATPMVEVAERAGVSRATVFWHFGDKAALFREAFNRLITPFRQNLTRDWSEVAPDKRVREQLELARRFGQEHSDALEAFVAWAMNNPQFRETVLTPLLDLNRRFAGELAESLAELVPEDQDPNLLALGLMLAVDANLLLSLFDPAAPNVEERHASIMALAELVLKQGDER